MVPHRSPYGNLSLYSPPITGEGQGWGLLFLFVKFAPRYTIKLGNPYKQREIYLFQHTLKVHKHTLYVNQHTRNIHADELF